ncbi:hypothetical protein MRX96_003681 [Rhipicephalus microplus]
MVTGRSMEDGAAALIEAFQKGNRFPMAARYRKSARSAVSHGPARARLDTGTTTCLCLIRHHQHSVNTLDGLPYELFKNLNETSLVSLTDNVNHMCTQCEITAFWTHAEIEQTPKPEGDSFNQRQEVTAHESSVTIASSSRHIGAEPRPLRQLEEAARGIKTRHPRGGEHPPTRRGGARGKMAPSRADRSLPEGQSISNGRAISAVGPIGGSPRAGTRAPRHRGNGSSHSAPPPINPSYTALAVLATAAAEAPMLL